MHSQRRCKPCGQGGKNSGSQLHQPRHDGRWHPPRSRHRITGREEVGPVAKHLDGIDDRRMTTVAVGMKFGATAEGVAQLIGSAAQAAGAQLFVFREGKVVQRVQLIEPGREQVPAQAPALAIGTGKGDGMVALRQNRNAMLFQLRLYTGEKIGAIVSLAGVMAGKCETGDRGPRIPGDSDAVAPGLGRLLQPLVRQGHQSHVLRPSWIGKTEAPVHAVGKAVPQEKADAPRRMGIERHDPPIPPPDGTRNDDIDFQLSGMCMGIGEDRRALARHHADECTVEKEREDLADSLTQQFMTGIKPGYINIGLGEGQGYRRIAMFERKRSDQVTDQARVTDQRFRRGVAMQKNSRTGNILPHLLRRKIVHDQPAATICLTCAGISGPGGNHLARIPSIIPMIRFSARRRSVS